MNHVTFKVMSLKLSYICLQKYVCHMLEFSFVKSGLLLKANSENVHCIFNASLMVLLFGFFIPM